MSRVVQNLILLWGICLMLILGLVVDQGRELQLLMLQGGIAFVILLGLTWAVGHWIKLCKRLLNLRFWLLMLAVFTVSAVAIVGYHEIVDSYYVPPRGAPAGQVNADRASYVENARNAFYLVCTGISC